MDRCCRGDPRLISFQASTLWADYRSSLRLQTVEGWWAHQDLNLEPADYEPAALTIELWARLVDSVLRYDPATNRPHLQRESRIFG